MFWCKIPSVQAQHQHSFKSPMTGRTYRIFGNMFCRADNCIYQWQSLIKAIRWWNRCPPHKDQQPSLYYKDQKKRIKEPVGEHFNISGHKWEDMIILTGQTQRRKARKSSGCIDSNYSDLMGWTNKWTSLKWTSHNLTSPDTLISHIVILLNLSTAPLYSY